LIDRANPPELCPYGIATVYVGLELGCHFREWEQIGSTIRPTVRGFRGDPTEILYLLGQGDLAARVAVSDFRAIAGLKYPGEKSSALVYNWVFSVPFVGPARTLEGRQVYRFMLHLRIKRGYYAKDPLARDVILLNRLRQEMQNQEITGDIQSGLGWADFIVDGEVSQGHLKRLLDFVMFVNSFSGKTGDETKPIFERTLTLLGYAWTPTMTRPDNTGPTNPDLGRALMVIRVVPGHLEEVSKILEEEFEGVTVSVVDGKSDLIVQVNGAKSGSFLGAHARFAEERCVGHVQKLETHLLLSGVNPRPAPIMLDDVVIEECACRLTLPRLVISDALPEELKDAVANLRFLFSAGLRDGTNCCDIGPAIDGCVDSLARISRNIDSQHARAQAAEVATSGYTTFQLERERLAFHEKILVQQKRIELWVLLSERILRQRTIGSFEEFLGQSDRAVVYRGGVQKLLFLTDHLMNDFYAKFVGLTAPKRIFASLYDSVGTILSVSGTGLIRIPAHHLFSLPLAIADLWHEVGVYRFFQQVDNKKLKLPLTTPVNEFLYRDLADHYGDLVVLLFGYHGDFTRFTVSLVHGWLDSQPYEGVFATAKQRLLEQLLARLVNALVFLTDSLEPLSSTATRRDRVEEAYDAVLRLVRENFTKPSWLEPTPLTRGRVLTSLASRRFEEAMKIITDLEFKPENVDEIVCAAETRVPSQFDARIREFNDDTDLNDVFGDLQWEIQSSRLVSEVGKAVPAFDRMAALSRSAAIEYYRRSAR